MQSGSTWEWDDERKQYYFHMFDKTMPDLNWECDQLKKEYLKMIEFWLDKGISGFKIDALSHLSKPIEFKNYPTDAEFAYGEWHTNGPKLIQFIKEMNKVIKSKGDNVMLAEMSEMTPEQMDDLNDPDNHSLDMHLSLDHMLSNMVITNDSFKYNIPKEFNLVEFKKIFYERYNHTINGWNSIYFINHDYVRPVSKFGKIGFE